MIKLFISLTNLETILVAVAAGLFAVAVAALITAIAAFKKIKKMKSTEVRTEKVIIENGVRYTPSDTVEKKDGADKVSHIKGDAVLKRGVEYIVSKNGGLLPGKYTILAADEKGESFYVRIGGFVREYYHNTPVVLSEGDIICSVSNTIVLR